MIEDDLLDKSNISCSHFKYVYEYIAMTKSLDELSVHVLYSFKMWLNKHELREGVTF